MNKIDRVQLNDSEREMEDADRNSLEFTAPGFAAKMKGSWTSQQAIIVIVVLACTGFLYYERVQSNRGFADQHGVTQAQNVVTQNMLAAILKGQSQLVNEVSESAQIQAYVLSISQAQREKLNLSMPPSLRARIRQGSQ